MSLCLRRALGVSVIVAMVSAGTAVATTSPVGPGPARTFDTPAPSSSPAPTEQPADPDPVVPDLANPAVSPGIVELTVGLPDADLRVSPITHALEAGYFDDAGFTSVEIVDVDEALLGILRAEIEFGVMDTMDAAEAVAQGLPLVALAGHQNYQADGSYGGDVLVGSTDVLADEGSTVTAFLSAYLRALGDLVDEPTLAPHDGGFGSLMEDGGLGELAEFVSAAGDDVDVLTLVWPQPLHDAQAWMGLPLNPSTSAEEVEE
jgi:hypothetical protein